MLWTIKVPGTTIIAKGNNHCQFPSYHVPKERKDVGNPSTTIAQDVVHLNGSDHHQTQLWTRNPDTVICWFVHHSLASDWQLLLFTLSSSPHKLITVQKTNWAEHYRIQLISTGLCRFMHKTLHVWGWGETVGLATLCRCCISSQKKCHFTLCGHVAGPMKISIPVRCWLAPDMHTSSQSPVIWVGSASFRGHLISALGKTVTKGTLQSCSANPGLHAWKCFKC